MFLKCGFLPDRHLVQSVTLPGINGDPDYRYRQERFLQETRQNMTGKDETNMKKIVTLLLTVCLVLSLAACGGEKKQADEAEDQKTISGVVNQLGSYLVLLDSDGEYHIFDFGEDVDQSSLEEGDRVTVTYTGTLDNEDPSPVAVAITQTES